MKFETVLFDLDGTLLNTLDDLTDAVNHVLGNHGYPLRTREQIRSALGNGARDLLIKSLPEGTDEETLARLLEEYQPWYLAHSQVKTAPYEGIGELLKELQKRGVKTAVVSNKGDLQVRPLAEKFFPEIPVAIGERKDLRRKPHPDMINEALRLLGVSPDGAALMGDSEVDGQTAKNAGIAFLAAGWGFRDREILETFDPALYLEHPADLTALWED